MYSLMSRHMHIERLNNEAAEEIHNKHYKNEFALPDFIKDTFINKFQVCDENNTVITSGGIRLIPEIILLTDKDTPVSDRKSALTMALDFMLYDARKLGLRNLHVFVKDQKWSERLKRSGFRPSEGECLIIEVEN